MANTTKPKRATRKRTSPNSVVMRSVWSLYTSPENDKLYRPIDKNDPDIIALAESIRVYGVTEPLVLTEDGYVLSGHRRLCAARLAELDEAPCRIKPFCKADGHDRFMRLLREYNRQRDKTANEKLREELVTVNADEAYQSLIEHRRETATRRTGEPLATADGRLSRSVSR